MDKKKILTLTIILAIFGLVILFSASSFIAYQRKDFHNDPYYFIRKQFIFLIIGGFFLFISSKLPLKLLHYLGYPAMFASTGLLSAILIFGTRSNGAKRWISIGSFTLQGSEIAEAAMILFLSFFLANVDKKSNKEIIFALSLCFINVALILIEPNVSTAFIFVAYIMVILFISRIQRKYIYSTFIPISIVFVFAILRYKHALYRILSFMHKTPESIQMQSSLLALGNGGIFGAGPGLGKIKLLYLPEAYTDYIFAIIGEEFGLFGSLTIIAIYFMFFREGIKASMHSVNISYKFLAFSISFIIFLKAIIHIGISAQMLPTTGIGLPLISYGGSSLIITLTLIGLLLNIAEHEKQFK